MQAITFAKGKKQHLKDCKDALCQSKLGEKYFSSPGSVENAILEGIRQGNLYVALIGEACIGFTYIIPKGAFHSFPYLHIITIKEEYRGQGVGKALLDYSEWIASEMADKLFLVVADYNPEAKRFYERNGYQQVGEIPNLYRPGITEYLMALKSWDRRVRPCLVWRNGTPLASRVVHRITEHLSSCEWNLRFFP